MGKFAKVIRSILSGNSDSNIAFSDLRNVLIRLGFQERVKGSHHIFWKDGLPEILNVQPNGSESKPYQVKQVRDLIVRYHLSGEVGDADD